MGKIRRKATKIEGNFAVNQIVFAKVSGFPEWPAKIIDTVGKNRFQIIFYGTSEKGEVGQNALFSYSEENKKRFVNGRTLKREAFKLAVKQADNEISQSPRINVEERPESGESEERAAFPISKPVLNNPIENKMNKLRVQRDFMEICNEVRVCLQINNQMNYFDALLHMQDFKKNVLPGVTRLMIFKYPEVAETFILLRIFHPNHVKDYETSTIEKIQSTATEICEQFKIIYDQRDDKRFKIIHNEREAQVAPMLSRLTKTDLFESTTMDELEATINAATASQA